MQKNPLVCANLKQNLSLKETLDWIHQIGSYKTQHPSMQIALAPVMPVLPLVVDKAHQHHIQIAAQNVGFELKGAYTGEWSVLHLADLSCDCVMIGHSERRQYFGETDGRVWQKTKLCLEAGIKPIVCVGESLKERQSGQVMTVLSSQLEGLRELCKQYPDEIILAYEPVWAIGTGVVPTLQEIEEAHGFMLSFLKNQVRVLYGGSVNGQNAFSIAQIPSVHGFLVGGASLNPQSFVEILKVF